MAQVFSTSPFVLGKRSGLSLQHNCGGAAGASPTPNKKRRHTYDEDDQDGSNSSSTDSSRRLHSGSPDTGSSHKRFRAVGSYSMSDSAAGGQSFLGAAPQQYQQPHQQHYQQQQEQQHADPRDQPQYSARVLEAELSKVRAECVAHIASKEAGMAAAAGAISSDLERSQAENRILKRAVTIQNTRCKEVEGQLAALQAAAVQAADYVKRLEQANYALGMRVQQIDAGHQHGHQGGTDFFGGHRPPDVF